MPGAIAEGSETPLLPQFMVESRTGEVAFQSCRPSRRPAPHQGVNSVSHDPPGAQAMRFFLATSFGILLTFLSSHFAMAGQSESQNLFFDQLGQLCGEQFVGEAVFPEDPGDDWRDKKLVAHIETCDSSEIRIPLHVGEDQSRTWIIKRVEGGLQLKHDHRHEDGTPDSVTMYGGTTQSPGSENAQSFPADSYTAQLIPDAATNEWFLSLNENGDELTYYLERNGQPRFKAVLGKQ